MSVDAALKAALGEVQLPYGDVLGEFGASDMTPVLVDGDELLLSALRSERAAAAAAPSSPSSSAAPQWLPVAFRVCHVLRRLTLSHLRFRVFFMAIKQLDYDQADLALRAALIRYLKVRRQRPPPTGPASTSRADQPSGKKGARQRAGGRWIRVVSRRQWSGRAARRPAASAAASGGQETLAREFLRSQNGD